MSQREFADALGISPSSLSSLYNGHTSPTNNHVQAIHRRFPEINVNWLLFGEGDMIDGVSETPATQMPAADAPATFQPAKDLFPHVVDAKPSGNAAQVPFNEALMTGQPYVREIVKYVDKPARNITEIRVFYDDGTYDTFSGRKES